MVAYIWIAYDVGLNQISAVNGLGLVEESWKNPERERERERMEQFSSWKCDCLNEHLENGGKGLVAD